MPRPECGLGNVSPDVTFTATCLPAPRPAATRLTSVTFGGPEALYVALTNLNLATSPYVIRRTSPRRKVRSKLPASIDVIEPSSLCPFASLTFTAAPTPNSSTCRCGCPWARAKLPSGTHRRFPQRVCRERHGHVAQQEDQSDRNQTLHECLIRSAEQTQRQTTIILVQ